MNIEKVIKELNQKYPGKAVFKNDEKETTEILCEIEPCKEHSEYSNAIAVIDKSIPHIHYKTTETYKVIKGILTLHVGNEVLTLKEGDSYVIKPNNVHWAEGDETWIECYSEPGWTLEDQIAAKNRDVAVVIFYDENGNVGVQHRESYSKAGEKYGLWGGRKEDGETPEEAMKREMQEELNYVPKQLEFWKEFTYVVDIEGDYLHWVINHDVFLSPITDELMNAKVEEGDDVKVMSMQEALDELDFRLIKPLLLDLKAKLGI
ncbi:NUDIX domain-containing protein [Patescibacteria group bacterium]|nr:NUDIX domain-containing protein [Patescibacteria group bacterium]